MLWPMKNNKLTWFEELIDSQWRRFVIGDDIFISYSHRDATYAAGLANALADRRFSCKIDQWGTDPGRKIPASLKRALLGSSVLVLICTEASGISEPVYQEVCEFLKTKRPIIPIYINGNFDLALYADWIRGVPVTADSPEALRTGNTSVEVVNRIEKTFLFTRKDQRLRRAAFIAALLLLTFIISAIFAASKATLAARQTQVQQRLTVDAQKKEYTAKLSEQRSSLIAAAEDAVTARDPVRALLTAQQALELDAQHPDIATSMTPLFIWARAINQGVPKEYAYFDNVISVKVNSSGSYFGAIGRISGAGPRSTALKVWSADGNHQSVLPGLFLALAFSKLQSAIVAVNMVNRKTPEGERYHFEVQWYSYDLRLLKTIRLQPLPIKNDRQESAVDPEMLRFTRQELLRNSSGRVVPAFYPYDIQDLQFSIDGTSLSLAGLATDEPWIANPHHYRASINTKSGQVISWVDEEHTLADFYENRERVHFLGNLPFLVSDGLKEIYLHDLRTRERMKIGEHSSGIADLSTSNTGKTIAAVGGDNNITVLSKALDGWIARKIPLPGDEQGIRIGFLDEDHVAVARENFTVTIMYIGDEGRFDRYPLDTSAGLLWQNRHYSSLSDHSDEVDVLEISRDGRWLATGGQDKTVVAWDLRRQDKRELLGNKRQIRCLSFDERGTILVSGGVDGVIRVWALDSSRFSVSADPNAVRPEPYVSRSQWDEGGDLSRRMIREHLGFVEHVKISPDGRWVLVSTYDGVRTLFSSELKVIKSLKEQYASDDVMFTGDSKWLVSTRTSAKMGTGKVLSKEGFDLWNVNTDKRIRVDSSVHLAEGMFSRDGLWAEKDSKDMLTLHSISSGISGSSILAGIFSSDGKWYALKSKRVSSKNADGQRGGNEVLLWKLSEPHSSPIHLTLAGPPVDRNDELENGDQVLSFDSWISFSSNDHYLLVSIHTPNGNAIDVVSLADFHQTVLKGDRVHGPFSISPNEQFIAGQGEAAAVYLWNIHGGVPKILAGHSQAVSALSFSPDSSLLATASDDRTARVWDTTSLESMEIKQTNPVAALAFTADGAGLIVGTGASLHRWYMPSGSSAKTLLDARDFLEWLEVKVAKANLFH